MYARLVEMAGSSRSSTAEAMKRFYQEGITFSPQSLTQIRSQRTNRGSRIARRLAEAQLVGACDASKKNGFYMQVIETGQRLRSLQHNTYHPAAFKSDRFTEEVAREVRTESSVLDRGLRAMRMDMICEDVFTELSGTNQALVDVAGRFFNDYLNCSPSHISEPKKRLNELWIDSDSLTTATFYKLLYLVSRSRRSIGTWVPYELDVMHAFYSGQREKGDKLTSFDLLTLKGEISGKTLSVLSGAIGSITQIPCDRNILMTQRNALINGSFETA